LEPHIYLNRGDETVDPGYWETSVRIKDMVLSTDSGCEVMSDGLPDTVKEIEKPMN
jgi:Xaa-Pro aminopeptidase